MRGLLRPCRHQLDPDLRERWRAHLCGLCLTLRDTAGQAARVLTGYDVLLLSVLVEAQQGRLPREEAGPCPLRGFAPASVVASTSDGARLAAAGALLSGAAGLADKTADGDLPRVATAPAARSERRLRRDGTRLAAPLGLDTDLMDRAGRDAREAEHGGQGQSLDDLLAPAGRAVAALFAHTAVVAGRPQNGPALGAAGEAFGRLVHLADAVQDLDEDRAAGRFNPLAATGTSPTQAGGLAEDLRDRVAAGLAGADLADRSLVDVLFGPVLDAAVRRLAPPTVPAPKTSPARAYLSLAATTAVAATSATLAVFGRPRRRGPFAPPGWGPGYGYDPYADPRYGYGSRYRRRGGPGPGCCGLLACDCCASSCCSAATGDDVCCCCV